MENSAWSTAQFSCLAVENNSPIAAIVCPAVQLPGITKDNFLIDQQRYVVDVFWA
jgi:hypothetical protein